MHIVERLAKYIEYVKTSISIGNEARACIKFQSKVSTESNAIQPILKLFLTDSLISTYQIGISVTRKHQSIIGGV